MKSELRRYLTAHRASQEATDFSDDESLLDAGVIDSMTMADLIVHLENEYGIRVDEDDMIPENFDSIDAIVAYLQRKTGQQGAV